MGFFITNTVAQFCQKSLVPILGSAEIADKIANGEFVLRDHNNTHKVWSVFAKIYNLTGGLIFGFVCCKVCKRVLTFSKSESTSNLMKHRCYRVKCVFQLDVSEFRNFSNSPIEDGFNDYVENNLMNLFTKCLISNSRSYELLLSDDFKAIFQELITFGANFGENIDIEKVIPNMTEAKRNIIEIYESCFARVNIEISAIKDNGFGLACHVSTNDTLKKSYFVLTIHFVSCGKVTSRLLGLRSVADDKYFDQTISENINDILKDYGCELSGTSLIAISGCSNILKAQTFPCINTALNKALTESIENIPEILQLLKYSIKICRFLNGKEDINITLEQPMCPDQWLFLLKELVRLAASWDCMEEIKESRNKVPLENINKKHLDGVLEILKPFKEALEDLADESRATLPLVIVYLHDLKKTCEATESEFQEFKFIKKLKHHLREKLEKIASENVTIFHKIALFLYPPANRLLQFEETEKQQVEAECKRLMKSFHVESQQTFVEQKSTANNTFYSKRKQLFSEFVNSERNIEISELVEGELQIYKMKRVEDSDDFDVFNWWTQQQQTFPLLFKLSQLVLSTPATSFAAKNIFVSVGSLINNQKSEYCWNEKEKEHIAFIKFNAHPDELE